MTHVVCAILTNFDQNVLVCQRPHEKSEGGKWEFPGGKIEANETPEQALVREIKEELDLNIEVSSPLKSTTYGEIKLLPYRAKITSGTLTLHEHLDHRWIAAKEASSLAWATADIPVWKEIFH
jgi:8-oxo-dGTP diphosphatase